MQNKKIPAAAALALCLGAAAVWAADLCLWTDPATGLVTHGGAWMRYLPWLGLAAVFYLLGRGVSVRAEALLHRCPPVGVGMLVTGALAVAAGLMAILLPGEVSTTAAFANWLVRIVSSLLGGIWLVCHGLRACKGYGAKEAAPANALGMALPLLFFLRPLFWQFQVVPAAQARIACTVLVLKYSAAILFMLVLGKVLLVPGTPCGRSLFGAGFCAFLFCTCIGLPLLAAQLRCYAVWPTDFVDGVGLAVFGVCGLLAAWQTTGKDTIE